MIKLIFMLFFINLFFFVSCKKVATNNYEVELSEALDNFEEEKFDLAIEDFKDLLTRKPTDTLVTKYLSQSYILIIDISYTAVLESLAAFESDSSSSPDLKSTLDLLPDESTENTFNIVQALKYLEDSIQVTEDESKKQARGTDLLRRVFLRSTPLLMLRFTLHARTAARHRSRAAAGGTRRARRSSRATRATPSRGRRARAPPRRGASARASPRVRR